MAKKKLKYDTPSKWLIIVIVLSFLSLAYFIISYQNNKSIAPYPTPSETPSTDTVLRGSQKYLQNLLEGKVTHNQTKGTVKYNSYNSNIVNNLKISILSYKYEPGNTVFTEYDINSENIVDLSKEVSGFSSLKLGKQKVTTCAVLINCQQTEVEGHNLNNRMWGSLDRYFQSGLVWSRTYYTYDKPTEQLIYVTVTFDNVLKGEYLEGILQTRPEIKLTLQQIEDSVLSI